MVCPICTGISIVSVGTTAVAASTVSAFAIKKKKPQKKNKPSKIKKSS